MRRAATGIFCISLALGITGAAHAQGGDPAVEREAKARFQEGLTRVQARDFEGARVAFTQAYAVLHKPDILWNLALSEEKSGHLVEALAHFQLLDRDLPSSADHKPAQKHAEDLLAETGHVDVTAPGGTMVSIDGGPEKTCPLEKAFDVMPGHHVVNARIAGAPAKSIELDATAGHVVKADFGTDLPAPPAPPAPGGATPQIGDQGTPVPPPPAPDTATSSGGIPTAKLVTVIAVGGAAVLSAGLAAGFGVASTNAANTANTDGKNIGGSSSACTNTVNASTCSNIASQRSTQSTDHGISTALWVTAGVLAAADVAVWFLWPRSSPSASASTPPAARVQIVPGFGPGGAGLAAVGSF